VFLEKLTGPQVVDKIHTFYWTHWFITMSTRISS